MLILITNDDGIDAEGIKILSDVASDFGEVWVVAPAEEMSAASHSLTVRRRIEVKRMDKRKFAVEGSPVDSVLIGIFAILPRWPDLVLSGINHGYNLAEDVFYSGTVSAAREAALYGIPSIALSMERKGIMRWDTAEKVTREVLQRFSGRRDFKLLSVNFPSVPYGLLRGILWTYLGNRTYDRPVRRNGDGSFSIGGDPIFTVKEGSDVWAVLNLYVSISPLVLDLTDWKKLEEFKKSLNFHP
ncbi:MAG: 5'/3'-nucleotidase SurE [Thermotogae bacterium]|nr:5'/3'-nucleotidase SurE [Thermotogota bacterium]